MLAGSSSWTSGHQQIVIIYARQKNPLYVGGANAALAERWQRLESAVAQWKEITNVNSVIIFNPSWPNYWGQNIKAFITGINSDWFTTLYMQVFTKWSHFSKWALPFYKRKDTNKYFIVSRRTTFTRVLPQVLGSLIILCSDWQIANMTTKADQ